MITYLDNNLRAGRSVYVKNFGAFNFDISTDLPNIASRGRSLSPGTDLKAERAARKKIHHLRYKRSSLFNLLIDITYL